ncbi:MAG TPA: 4Fe-4S dicluster domain-containing protein, partial [Rhodothermales bacterium]
SQLVRYVSTGETQVTPQSTAISGLVQAIRAGQVDALVFVGSNPVYSAPAELDLADAVRQVPLSIHHGTHVDETAQLCTWHVPATHPLEAWGDGRAYDGTASIIQPLIAPLYRDARSEIEFINLLATGASASGYELVRETWQSSGEEGWRRALHDGVIPNTAFPTAGAASAGAASQVATPSADDIELVFRLDPSVLDGSHANNAWLQELPDPVTKVVWDNVAAMSQATADRLGVSVKYDAGKFYADTIEIAAGPSRVTLPVWIVPGLADNSITVHLGYGRSIASSREPRRDTFFNTETRTDVYAAGPLANGVGGNVSVLRNGNFAPIRVGDVQVQRTGERMLVSTTQEHGSMEGRPIVRFATLEEFRRQPRFAEEAVEVIGGERSWEEYPALWEENHAADQPASKDSPYHTHQWGMVIDLNTCTGCNACIVACDSENNIQMVGKEDVSRGREMHWLRVDRYYVTEAARGEAADAGAVTEAEVDYDDVHMVMQPLPCMHCENAPCEPVCPVAATVHSSDGLNSMVYNRCIGTRYCSNNCPYKVRHFNFFNWSKTIPAQVQMAQNPNVTIRFRGVMEKCTFCVQRIREANRRELVEGRPIEDGDVQTACQQVCPADAITFGDLADPSSAVSQLRRNPRRYELLAELNTKPRTSYLAQVRNPNPQLSGRA